MFSLASLKQKLHATIDNYRFTRQLFSYRLSNLDYPDKLFHDNSYPWLPFRIHKQRKTQRKLSQNSNSPLIVYYRSRYNKHIRSDKIVQSILHKCHSLHIPNSPKLTIILPNFTACSLPIKYYTPN